MSVRNAFRSVSVVLAATLVTSIVLIAAPPAHADVLVSAPKAQACFQEGIRVGVWYQSESGGAKWFTIKIIKRDTGRVKWSRSGTASADHWKYWRWYPSWPAHFRVVYLTPSGRIPFNVWRYGCE